MEKFDYIEVNYNTWGGNGSVKVSTYSTTKSRIGIPLEYIADLKSKISKIKPITRNEITPTEKLYFSKSSMVPRFKVKEFLLQNTTTEKTRIAEYATLIIYNKHNFPDLLNKSEKQIYLQEGYVLNNNPENIKLLHINNPTYIKSQKFLFVPKDYVHSINTYTKIKIESIGTYIKFYSTNNQAEIDLLSNIDKILSTNARFIDDYEFQRNIQTESIIIDNDIYDNLRGMLAHKDKENISLAIDIMANVNYDKSKLYLLLLLNEFAHNIWRVTFTTNFKGLLNYLQTRVNQQEWKECVNNLFKEFKGEHEIEVIKQYIIRKMSNEFSNNLNFKITDIKIELK